MKKKILYHVLTFVIILQFHKNQNVQGDHLQTDSKLDWVAQNEINWFLVVGGREHTAMRKLKFDHHDRSWIPGKASRFRIPATINSAESQARS